LYRHWRTASTAAWARARSPRNTLGLLTTPSLLMVASIWTAPGYELRTRFVGIWLYRLIRSPSRHLGKVHVEMDSAGRLEGAKTPRPLKVFAFSFAPANRPESGGAGSSACACVLFLQLPISRAREPNPASCFPVHDLRQPLQSANCRSGRLAGQLSSRGFGRRGLAAAGRASRRRRNREDCGRRTEAGFAKSGDVLAMCGTAVALDLPSIPYTRYPSAASARIMAATISVFLLTPNRRNSAHSTLQTTVHGQLERTEHRVGARSRSESVREESACSVSRMSSFPVSQPAPLWPEPGLRPIRDRRKGGSGILRWFRDGCRRIDSRLVLDRVLDSVTFDCAVNDARGRGRLRFYLPFRRDRNQVRRSGRRVTVVWSAIALCAFVAKESLAVSAGCPSRVIAGSGF